MPALSARVRVEFDKATDRYYAMRGTPEEIAAEVRKFAELGVEHLALFFAELTPQAVSAAAERFSDEVATLV